MDALKRIKRLIILGNYVFTAKADAERLADGLSQEHVLESILNATFVRIKRSRSSMKTQHRERIYIIEGFTYDGVLIYTKGVIRKVNGIEAFYVLVSAKRSTYGD